jgi:glycosyltransferase involved in cell wall biosynthesis
LQFFYVDPGLRSNLGHHANSCRLITSELRQRGIYPHIFVHNTIEPELSAELGAAPHFRWWTYGTADFDPIAGWMTSFMRIATETAQDLARLPTMGFDDIVYLNSSQPPQLMALLQWLLTFPAERRPNVITEFGTGPGLDYEITPDGLHVHMRDPRTDPRAVLYRFAAGLIPALQGNRLHLFTFEAMSSQLYSFLLKTHVSALPLPHASLTQTESRVGRRPITVSVLGHQRPEKGFALVPEIAALLLASRSDIKLLVHNGDPTNMPDAQQKLRDLARIHSRLELDERTADPVLWQELLQRSDLILCPYPVWNFAAAYSAVAAEAVAAGIPLVVPAKTTLSALVKQYGGGGTLFAPHEPAAIVRAVLQAIDQFDALAEIATRGSVEWHKNMGAKKMVEALLALVPSTSPVAAAERALA